MIKTIIWNFFFLKKLIYIFLFILKIFFFNLQVSWWSDPASTASWSWWYGEPVSGFQPFSGFPFAPQLQPYISLCCTRSCSSRSRCCIRSCSSGSSGSDECCGVGSTARLWPSSLSHWVSTWTWSNMVLNFYFFLKIWFIINNLFFLLGSTDPGTGSATGSTVWCTRPSTRDIWLSLTSLPRSSICGFVSLR